jgi:hypothetical protein
MKKIMLSAVVCTALIMSSCGAESDSKKGEEKVKKDPMSEMCECFDMAMEVSKEMMEAGGDEEKMAEIEDKHMEQKVKCDELGDKMQEEMKGATEEENEAKMQEFADACPAAKEMMGM